MSIIKELTKVARGNTNKYIIFIMTEGYCVKCKAKQEMKDEKEVEMKGKGGMKRRALKGECPKCATKMFRILGKSD